MNTSLTLTDTYEIIWPETQNMLQFSLTSMKTQQYECSEFQCLVYFFCELHTDFIKNMRDIHCNMFIYNLYAVVVSTGAVKSPLNEMLIVGRSGFGLSHVLKSV